MIKVILFDIGGVLIDYKTSMYYRGVAVLTGKDAETVRKAFEPVRRLLDLGSISVGKAEMLIASRLGIRESHVQWGKGFMKLARRNKKMQEVARLLSKRYRLAILSNFSYIRYRYTLEHLINKELFPQRFVSCYLHMAKPDKYGKPDYRLYRYVISKLHVKPPEILFIDDLEENLAPARKLGMNVILFEGFKNFQKKLHKFGVR